MTERLPPPDVTKFKRLKQTDVRIVEKGTLLGRIYSAGGGHPATWDAFRHFGPTTARFDHQTDPRREHPERGILYAAAAVPSIDGNIPSVLRTCLAEVYRDRGVVELSRGEPHFVLFRATRDLRLLDLADSDWLTRSGGNSAIASGTRSRSRDWARAIYRHYQGDEAVDGVYYPCSNVPPARSVALWERSTDALPDRPDYHTALSHPGLRPSVERSAFELGLGLIA